MSIFFVEENDKLPIFKFKKIIVNGEKILINRDVNKINLRSKVKIVNLLRRYLLENKSKQIILSENLKKNNDFFNLLQSNNIDIVNGKWLFKILVPDIVEEIVKKNNLKKEELEIIFTVNKLDSQIENYIELFSMKFKSVGIVTNHISKFKRIEEKLYKNNGILITVTNNRRKSLLKSNIIINIDFPKELLNKFAINDNAIIINIEEESNIKKKRFCGEIINNYEINVINYKEYNDWCKNQKIDIGKYDMNNLIEVYARINGIEKNKIKIIV